MRATRGQNLALGQDEPVSATGRECAWCGAYALDESVPLSVSRISHVICSGCLEAELEALGRPVPAAA